MVDFANHYTLKYPLGFRWVLPPGTKRHSSARTFLIQPLCGPGKAAILPCKTGLDVVVPAGLKLGLLPAKREPVNAVFAFCKSG